MDVDTYIELTGNEVDDSERAAITAQIRRTRIALESMLGYSLDKKKASENQYEEKGKTTSDCIFRGTIGDIDFGNLTAPDEVIGSYRLFSFRKNDQFFPVDPFKTLHKVKLVFVKSGDEPNGITHKTFDEHNVRVVKKNGFAKYIENCKDCFCSCLCEDCVQLAVDADWINESCVPEELLMVWADMVEYYSDPKGDIVSETLGTHSYKREIGDAPEKLDQNLNIIRRYAGPNGSVFRTVAI